MTNGRHFADNLVKLISWWRHQMETFSALLAICAGNSPVPGEFPAQRPVTRSFDVFFDLRLNKRFSKQLGGWWFETLSRPLWRHRNVLAWKWLYFYSNFIDMCSSESNWLWSSTDSDNDFARRQAIIWSNDGYFADACMRYSVSVCYTKNYNWF